MRNSCVLAMEGGRLEEEELDLASYIIWLPHLLHKSKTFKCTQGKSVGPGL